MFFTGQGVKGDQTLAHFNAELADHLALGLQVQHFTTPPDEPGMVRYEGEVAVRTVRRVERETERRTVLEFELVPAGRRSEERATSYGRVFTHVLDAGKEARAAPHPRDLSPFMEVLHQRAFRRLVRHAYGDACAACGATPEDADGVSGVGAVPIRRIREGGPYAVPNGLALCPAHGWSFTHGLLTLTDALHVAWLGSGKDPIGRTAEGTRIRVPENKGWGPALAHVRHHRKKWRRVWRTRA